ncbi:MAG: CPBP family intramembrane metalloprotease [Gudongella sp.]|nr:CPBP family intramembrane metalloprotease [Gudongella sp.]
MRGEFMESRNQVKINRELRVFFLVTFAFTWILWILALLSANLGMNLWLSQGSYITLGIFVPSTAGIVCTYIFGGKAEAYGLIRSMTNIHMNIKWLLQVFLVLPGVSAVATLVYVILGNALPEVEFPPWFIPIVFVYILVLMGPLGEEAGWRGFALKRLLMYQTPIKASVILGMIWSIWHLPLFFIVGTTQNLLTEFGLIPVLFGYSVYTIMISILITVYYIKTDYNLFGAIILHTMGNLSLGFLPIIFTRIGAIILLVVLCIMAASIVYKYGYQIL